MLSIDLAVYDELGFMKIGTVKVKLCKAFIMQHVLAGQFGSRLQGGKDAASARYIFTRLDAITRKIFNEADDHLLTYLTEEGQSIEPAW